jgi:hypothetical protein
MKKKYRKLEKWENKHPNAKIVLYRDNNRIDYKKLPHDDTPNSISETILAFFIIITLLGVFGIFVPWIMAMDFVYDLISLEFDGDTVALFIGSMFFAILSWTLVIRSLFFSPNIELLCLENYKLFRVRIPIFGTRVQEFDISKFTGVEQGLSKKGIFLHLEGQRTRFIFSGVSTIKLDFNRINESINQAK